MNTNETHRAADEAAFAQWREARRTELDTRLCALRHRLRKLAPVALAQRALIAPVWSGDDEELPRASAPVAVVELGDVAARLYHCEQELLTLGAPSTGTQNPAFDWYCCDVLSADEMQRHDALHRHVAELPGDE